LLFSFGSTQLYSTTIKRYRQLAAPKKTNMVIDLEIIKPERRRVTPQQAVKILKQHGTMVSVEEAKLILDFMYAFGKLAIDQYVKI
jgi:hypothetical protein